MWYTDDSLDLRRELAKRSALLAQLLSLISFTTSGRLSTSFAETSVLTRAVSAVNIAAWAWTSMVCWEVLHLRNW